MKHKTTKYVKRAGFRTIDGFFISMGNDKVRFPLVNLESATHCSSAAWCPFSLGNYKQSGRKQCYAQVIERIYKRAYNVRVQNSSLIMHNTKEQNAAMARRVAWGICEKIKKFHLKPIVRLGESGDLNNANVHFAASLAQELSAEGVNLYLYSKAPKKLRDRMTQAGATVLHSERDFVAVKHASESPLPLCPGICGPCTRCPDGLQTAILELSLIHI